MKRVRLNEPSVKKRVRLSEKPKRTRVRLYEPTKNEHGDESSLDLKARRIIMSAMLYYGLNTSLIPDEVNDRWVRDLVRGYDQLDRVRQWALGPVEALQATTMRVKVTSAAVGGAVAWLQAAGVPHRQVQIRRDWEWSKRYQTRWLSPEDFYW